MNASIDISYYPLLEEFITDIQSFIDRLNKYPEILVKTNGMSTQVFGEYRVLMEIITDEIEKSFKLPNSIFVLKIANAHLDNYIPYNV